LKVAPPVKVCTALHVTDDAAVTKPGFTNDIAPVEVLNETGDVPENSEYSVEVEREMVWSEPSDPPPERMPPLFTLRLVVTTSVPFFVMVTDALKVTPSKRAI